MTTVYPIPRCTQCGRFVGECSDNFKKTLNIPKTQKAYFCEQCLSVYIVVD